jgi:hypothetical protein
VKRTFIHIGYPKCASSALQIAFFTPHPELFYLGPHRVGLSFGYYNDDVKALAEVHWRLMKDFGYDREWAVNVIGECYEAFLASNKSRMGLSFEGFSYTHNHDIDVTQKAQRLADVFGPDTRIVMIIRNQFDLIKSLYRELIVGGLTSSFHKFASDIFYNKFRSFIYDLDYFKMYNLYAHHFGAENVLVLPYEQLQSDSEDFLNMLSTHIGVRCTMARIPRLNESESDAVYEHFRELSMTYRHGMGLSISQPIYQFRYEEYIRDVERVPVQPNSDIEKALHPILWHKAMEIARDNPHRKIQYDMPTYVEQWLTEYYGQANANLARIAKLPLESLGYILH